MSFGDFGAFTDALMTEGLSAGTGLSLVTRGFLLEDSTGSAAAQIAASAAVTDVRSGDLVVDVAMLLSPEFLVGDPVIQDGQPVFDTSLRSPVILSLFTDRLANIDDDIPDGTEDRRGWQGDAFASVPGFLAGSRLWTLSRAKQTAEVLADADEMTREALEWLIEDQVAERIDVTAAWGEEPEWPRGTLLLEIEIHRPTDPNQRFRFAVTWESPV